MKPNPAQDAPPGTTWEVGERHQGWRLDRFLCERVPKLSRTQIQKVITERISLSWRSDPSPSTRVVAGGFVTAGFPVLEEIPVSEDFPVLYEDSTLLAVDKPSGWVVHPTNSCRANSVIEILRRTRNAPELRLVHRLDRETSGVLLLAKDAQAARLCGLAFMRKSVRKFYVARVRGTPPAESGTIDAPIGRDPRSRVHVRRTVTPDGESAVTKYRLLSAMENGAIVELEPITGRCHQLRVHMESIGCPILGDPLYGHPDEVYLRYIQNKLERTKLHLHAWKLEGNIGGKAISVETPLPAWVG